MKKADELLPLGEHVNQCVFGWNHCEMNFENKFSFVLSKVGKIESE